MAGKRNFWLDVDRPIRIAQQLDPWNPHHYGNKATRNHVAHSYWNELTITDAKLCVAAGHLYVWGDGNNSNQHQNGASTSIGTSTNNTNIGNSSQWSCRANIHSKDDLIAVRNVGANGSTA